MSFPVRLSRRAFAALAAQAAAGWGSALSGWALGSGPAAARDPHAGADRGLGGTGAAPADPDEGLGETLGQDRGIGGTGVVGTIRRFGSVVVNDLRVTFPPGVAVTIDGRRATARDLRLGHVVRVLARARGGVLATRAIVAESEVVGPVDAVGPGRMVVLGQRVVVPAGVPAPRPRVGERVAVSGLRRPDGAVVASLIEARPRGPDRLRGPVAAGVDGVPAVGGLAVAGLGPELLGRRVSLAGARRGGAFRPSAVTVEPRVPFAAADRLSVEGYVARAPDGLRLGSGLAVAAGTAVAEAVAEAVAKASAEDGAVRAVVVGRPDPSGRLDAQSLRVEAGSRGADRGGVGGGPGGPNPGIGGPAAPGGPGAGRPDAGPRGGAPGAGDGFGGAGGHGTGGPGSGGGSGGGPGGGGPGGGRGGPGR